MNETSDAPTEETAAPDGAARSQTDQTDQTEQADQAEQAEQADQTEQAEQAVARATRLSRQRDQRVLGGVAAGIARSLDLDPLVVRVTLAVLGLFGVGVVLYVALWLLLPDEAGDHAVLDLEERTRGVVVLGVLGVTAVWAVGLLFGVDGTPLAVIALIGGLLLWRRERRTDRRERATWAAGAGEDGRGTAGDPAATPPRATAAQRRLARRDARTARRRDAGPLLLGPTAAVAALACGVLGLVGAGSAVAIPASAYVATCLAVVGLALVVASRYGRPLLLGIIGLGLAVALVPTTVAESWETETRTVTPATAAGIPVDTSFEVVDYELDLTGLGAEELAGRSAAVSSDLGSITVRVPADVPVALTAAVEGVGEIRAMESVDARFVREGFGLEAEPVLLDPSRDVLIYLGGAAVAPPEALRLDLSIGFGEIRVERAP